MPAGASGGVWQDREIPVLKAFHPGKKALQTR
jgi:hypothetical protein